MTESRQIRNNRKPPQEWDGLLEFANIATQGRRRPSTSDAADMFDEVKHLDTEQLEANYYYGLGQIICDFAQLLHKPSTRQSSVDWAANSFVRYYVDARANGHQPLTLDDLDLIHSISFSPPFTDLAHNASRSMSRGTRLLVDTLACTTGGRRFDKKYSPDTPWEGLSDYDLKAIAKGMPAADAVGRAAAVGATFVVRSVLIAEGNKRAGTITPLLENRSHRVKDLADINSWDSAALRRLALKVSGMRIDEFESPKTLAAVVQSDKDGNIIFRDNVLPAEPLPPAITTENNPAQFRRVARLRCPAVEVTGMISLMLGIVPEVIFKAADRIEKANTALKPVRL